MDVVFVRRALIWILIIGLLIFSAFRVGLSAQTPLARAEERASVEHRLMGIDDRIAQLDVQVAALEQAAGSLSVTTPDPAELARQWTETFRGAFARGDLLNLQTQQADGQRLEFLILWRGSETQMLTNLSALGESAGLLQVDASAIRHVELNGQSMVELTLRASLNWSAP